MSVYKKYIGIWNFGWAKEVTAWPLCRCLVIWEPCNMRNYWLRWRTYFLFCILFGKGNSAIWEVKLKFLSLLQQPCLSCMFRNSVRYDRFFFQLHSYWTYVSPNALHAGLFFTLLVGRRLTPFLIIADYAIT